MTSASGAFILLPNTSEIGYILVLVAYALMAPFSFWNETHNNAGYSKFFVKKEGAKSVPSQWGMTLLYGPAFAWSVVGAIVFKNSTAVLSAMHFGKRIFEAYFVHKYSGDMENDFILVASIYYATNATAAFWYASPAPFLSLSTPLGLIVFAVGMAGNLYHHILLSNLRKPGDTKYTVPHGGLFEYVACPHYFFEILIWLGIGIYGRAALGYMPPIAFLGYLMGRSRQTTAYYNKKLGEEYPKDRKHMIPFVF